MMSHMTANTPRDLLRLAAAAKARRRDLGLTIAAVAEAATMSKDTYKRVEAGLPIRDSSYTKVDRTLNWAPGSSVAILEGAENAIAVGSTVGSGITLASIPDDEVKGVVTNVIVAVSDTLTAREIREISDRVLEELRQRSMIDSD